jgi:hypothetical protein
MSDQKIGTKREVRPLPGHDPDCHPRLLVIEPPKPEAKNSPETTKTKA